VGFLLSKRAFADFKKRLDYSEYGGAPLLGVKGICIIGHGSSNANAIKNAIRIAAEFAERGINQKIAQEIAGRRDGNRAAIRAAQSAEIQSVEPSGMHDD
jgi:glycerol-3-phosphate acyltransferase PlsX